MMEKEQLNTFDKELLLKDLCARLPYGVKISIPELWVSEKKIEVLNEIFKGDDGLYRVNDNGMLIEHIKPYLSPLSSMTEEQRKELNDTLINLNLKALSDEVSSEVIATYEIDFYNKNHFDYRGLIPKGLAIDATGKNIY